MMLNWMPLQTPKTKILIAHLALLTDRHNNLLRALAAEYLKKSCMRLTHHAHPQEDHWEHPLSTHQANLFTLCL
jgi:hypothetical protein